MHLVITTHKGCTLANFMIGTKTVAALSRNKLGKLLKRFNDKYPLNTYWDLDGFILRRNQILAIENIIKRNMDTFASFAEGHDLTDEAILMMNNDYAEEEKKKFKQEASLFQDNINYDDIDDNDEYVTIDELVGRKPIIPVKKTEENKSNLSSDNGIFISFNDMFDYVVEGIKQKIVDEVKEECRKEINLLIRSSIKKHLRDILGNVIDDEDKKDNSNYQYF